MSGVSFNDTTSKAGPGGANQTLSNLTSDAVAINTTLAPDSDSSYYLGLAAKLWGRLYVGQIRDASEFLTIHSVNRRLINAVGTPALDWSAATLRALLDILPETDRSSDLGSTSVRFEEAHLYSADIYDTGLDFHQEGDLWLNISDGKISGTTAASVNLQIQTAGRTGEASKGISLITGSTTTSGTVGDINLTVGTPAGGAVRGQIITSGHIASVQTTKPVAGVQAAAGGGATADAETGSTDTNGKIILTTGTVTLSTGAQVIITFNLPYLTAPDIILNAGNSAAAVAAAAVGVYATSTTTTFSIAVPVALTAATEYIFYYHVLGR